MEKAMMVIRTRSERTTMERRTKIERKTGMKRMPSRVNGFIVNDMTHQWCVLALLCITLRQRGGETGIKWMQVLDLTKSDIEVLNKGKCF